MPYGLPLIYNENKSGPAGDKSRTGQCGITLWRRCRQPQLAQPQSCFLAQFFFSLTFFQSKFSFVSNNFSTSGTTTTISWTPFFQSQFFVQPSLSFVSNQLFPPGVASNSRHDQRSLRTWLQVQVRPIFIVGRKSFQIGFGNSHFNTDAVAQSMWTNCKQRSDRFIKNLAEAPQTAS